MKSADVVPPAVSVSRPAGCPSPVVISVPHAGRHFPLDILSQARVDAGVLGQLGDGWCDLLAIGAVAGGAASVIAGFARAVADCNRAEGDMSPDEVAGEIRDQFTAPGRKERAGLGVVPTRLAPFGPLWKMPIDGAAMASRLDRLHRPYHAALASLLDRARRQHGWALLIDLHSMPPIPVGQRGHGAHIVVGDAFGRGCASWISEMACNQAESATVPVSRNQPYAGGHIIRRHGDPKRGIHALQIELDRRLYLDGQGLPVASSVARWSAWLTRLVASIADEKLQGDMIAQAAE